ncbi:polysaccharide deacetylase family protein [Mariniflexile litorale]|uniref:Polysaccharide deacetylase family protein n=1 Tax=Mariniflexile litorale TaxID=3045158 RepID=A0AAU7EGJ2_9FLAO|nr:polysaccharide deacetylase family protein [Mariniflexile sp. KMM 9835]MDQ8211933.1 polysaccharide deacetylase family protein [Mariniflexile sp. KMM 9835]
MKTISTFLFICTITFCNSQILKKQIPDKLVVLTFDDAPASHYSIVAPLLKDYGFGATFFVCEFPPNYKDSTLYMNWRQIKMLDKLGFEVANHTRTHANVTKLTQAQFNEELEYIENKCDSLNILKPTNFAYPGYGLNSKVLDFLDKKRYVFARAGGSRVYDPLIDHPYLIPSWAIDENNKTEIMAALDKAKKGKIIILTFHGIPDMEHPWVNTPPRLFKEYLKYLSDHKFKVISLKDLNNYINTDKAKETIVVDMNKPLKN